MTRAPDFDLFINRVKSLFNIDGDLLPELSSDEQRAFVRDPVRYLMKANDAQAEAIFREVEKRQCKVLTATRKPKFGERIVNPWASDDNPTKTGIFVREFRRTGRLNPGTIWEFTDGDGRFWEINKRAFFEDRSAYAPSTTSSDNVAAVSS